MPDGGRGSVNARLQARPLNRERTLEMQRARLVDAMVLVIDEHGVRGATVARVVRSAEVSRATFYELFESIEACFIAVLDSMMRRGIALVSSALAADRPWHEQALAGLTTLLSLLDSDPLLARVCLVEALAAGPAALAYRARELEILKHLVEGVLAQTPAGHHAPKLTAEAIVASIAGILQNRLVTGQAPPFGDLLAPLAALIITPCAERHSELAVPEHVEELARLFSGERALLVPSAPPRAQIPKGLRTPQAFRARACIVYLREHPASSNRTIADAIGVSHLGQASTLLGRLAAQGLLTKEAGRPGTPNAWWLTAHGDAIAGALGASL